MAIEKVAARVRLDGATRVLHNGLGLRGEALMILSNDLYNLRHRIANFGRGQVNEELKRQR